MTEQRINCSFIKHCFHNTCFQNIANLRRVYKNVEDIDLFIGMIVESPNRSSKALVADTFLCLIGDQFARLKQGDRYFYDLGGQSGSFTQGNYFYLCRI